MADEKTVKVDLNHSVGYRPPGGGRARLYGPGKGVEMPEDVAKALGLKGKEAQTQVEAKAAADDRAEAEAKEAAKAAAKKGK